MSLLDVLNPYAGLIKIGLGILAVVGVITAVGFGIHYVEHLRLTIANQETTISTLQLKNSSDDLVIDQLQKNAAIASGLEKDFANTQQTTEKMVQQVQSQVAGLHLKDRITTQPSSVEVDINNLFNRQLACITSATSGADGCPPQQSPN